MLIKCPSKKCSWCGTPTFVEIDDKVYVKMVCPLCHTFIKIIKREDVPEDDAIITQGRTWWDTIKKTESQFQPAYILQRELSALQADYAALQAENETMKDIINEAKNILMEALEKEGLIDYVPKWMEE